MNSFDAELSDNSDVVSESASSPRDSSTSSKQRKSFSSPRMLKLSKGRLGESAIDNIVEKIESKGGRITREDLHRWFLKDPDKGTPERFCHDFLFAFLKRSYSLAPPAPNLNSNNCSPQLVSRKVFHSPCVNIEGGLLTQRVSTATVTAALAAASAAASDTSSSSATSDGDSNDTAAFSPASGFAESDVVLTFAAASENNVFCTTDTAGADLGRALFDKKKED